MPANQLLSETQQILDDARGLLDRLPPMSPDHEDVRLAVVKLRQQQRSLTTQTDLSSKVLAQSRNTVHEARTVVEGVRASVAKRTRRSPQRTWTADQPSGTGASAMPSAAVTVFLDMDTVLLAKHQGRYGPELGLQADISDAIERLFQIADRVVVVVNPSSSPANQNLDTEHRVAKLRDGLDGTWDGLVIATCQHGEDGTCTCAKPGHGLIAAHLDQGRRADDGWYIGGDQEGMVAGRTAGLRTIRIGPHAEDHVSAVHRPDYEARDLLDAANHILAEALTAP